MLSLRAFMFERVYLGPHVLPEHERAHAAIERIFEQLTREQPDPDAVIDFIAGMTDRYALTYAAKL
jgi:dGTP triphosphohydrolase